MLDLFLLGILKLSVSKFIMRVQQDILTCHILSTAVPLFIFLFYGFFLSYNFEYSILILMIFLFGSYIILNVPGAYVTSLRIAIFKIIGKNGITIKDFYEKFNDNLLFENRFKRLIENNIILKLNYNINKILYLFLS